MKTVTRTVLIADEGMVLTDGEHYGKSVYLAEGADASVWHEVSEDTILAENENNNDEIM